MSGLLAPAVFALALLSSVSGVLAADGGDFAPKNILQTNSRFGWLCMVRATQLPSTGSQVEWKFHADGKFPMIR